MRFDKLDLNLLVALDALLSERSVSHAAERICLSQSATSSALGRLRDYFGDELLVQVGRTMVPTAKAEALVGPVREILEQIRATITEPPLFDPASAQRTIRIMASDYVTEVLLAAAINDLLVEAPQMGFEIQPVFGTPADALEQGRADLIITVDYAISADHPSRLLFEDDYVVVGWSGNPALAGEMTRELYFALGHVTARFERSRVSAFDDWFVTRQEQRRRNVVIAPSFLSLPGLVVGSDRIATMHRRHATQLASYLPLALRELPFDMPPVRETAQWHISNDDNPAVRWVLEGITATARNMGMCGPEGGDRAVVAPSHVGIAAQFLGYHERILDGVDR